MATAIVHIFDGYGNRHPCRALCDPGSQVSFVTSRFFNALAIRRNRCKLQVEGIGDSITTYTHGKAHVLITSSTNALFQIGVELFIIDEITSPTPTAQISENCWQHLRDLALADPTFGHTGRIDALIGADIWGQLLTDGIIRGRDNEPCAQSTQLGWVVFGPAETQVQPIHKARSLAIHSRSLSVRINDERTDTLLRQLFEVKEAESLTNIALEADICERIFMKTYYRDKTGRYFVQFPFRLDASTLGNSHQLALRQFYQLERRLLSNPRLREMYTAFMREYHELGHMYAIDDQPGDPSQSFFIPHHAVLKESSETTKLRTVFNASAKSTNGISLNDTQMAGPMLQDLLVHILYRFRRFAIAIAADVEKMFRMVHMDRRHRQWQQILWRESPDEPLQTYQLATVTYGTASGPYLAIRAMQQCARDNCHILIDLDRAKAALETILCDFYVDDLLKSVSTTQQATQLAQDVSLVLKQGCFNLRQWRSNDKAFLAQVIGHSTDGDMDICLAETTILGLQWNSGTDELFYRIRLEATPSTTKRQILSEAARIYDPTGMLAPVTVVNKIFIQKLCKAGLEWDVPLPDDLLNEWLTYRNDLVKLEQIRIPRCLGILPDTTLHMDGYCDASFNACAAVVYITTHNKEGKRITRLIAAKTRVASIGGMTIPRLELTAAHLLTSLMMDTRQAMELQRIPYTMWSDSSIVLCWLRKSTSQLKQFVANRVGYIQQHTDIGNWRHIRTQFNPADCASRGISVNALINHQLWWYGPADVLRSAESHSLNEDDRGYMELELKPVKTKLTRTAQPLAIETRYQRGTETIIIDLLHKFSTLGKLLRTTAYIFRWRKANKSSCIQPVISAKEMSEALNWHILAEQARYFGEEISQLRRSTELAGSSKLKALNPYLEETTHILRARGRLQNAQLPIEQRRPIILAKDSVLSRLIVQQAHKDTLHGGIQLMLQTLRQNYWILHVRTLVKQCCHECTTCRRQRHSLINQQMASLPLSRVTPTPPFSVSGVDFCGPFNIRIGSKKARTQKKTYVAIFICMSTKAVHIELAEDLSAEAFINVFTRFVNRRGPCHRLTSDNGTNFTGANKILQADLKAWHSAHTQQHLANHGTEWHFNPPGAPHQGGIWEAAVKSAKKHLTRIVGTNSIYYDQFHTLLVHVEACMNSRPLVALHDTLDDHLALSPADFLVGRSIVAVPDKPVLDIPTNRLTYWHQLRQMQQHFWRQWHREYLGTLQQRSKWHKATDDLKIGDVVIIREENLPATRWRLGKVTELHPGSDGLTRVVSIRHQQGEFRRPVQKVCKLLDLPEHTCSAGQNV